LRQGVRLFEAMRNFNGVSFCVQGLSWCAASAAPDESSARLLGAAQAVWRSTGGNFAQAIYRKIDDESAALLRERLGDARFEAAFAEGASYSLEQALAAALGEAPARQAPTAARSAVPGTLTRREWEIAELIAQGLSNKEIADRLVISRRTAETHVENILTKLGFRSRVQVSRWIAEERGR
jgi:DNA-binding CsgD family transcriptional regulator